MRHSLCQMLPNASSALFRRVRNEQVNDKYRTAHSDLLEWYVVTALPDHDVSVLLRAGHWRSAEMAKPPRRDGDFSHDSSVLQHSLPQQSAAAVCFSLEAATRRTHSAPGRAAELVLRSRSTIRGLSLEQLPHWTCPK